MAKSRETMIEVTDVTKFYGPLKAVDNLSFSLERGEILGFLGPNGAGKTTTMKILTCYMPPTTGRATVMGRDVFRDALEVRSKIGYLPENAPLYADMTPRDPSRRPLNPSGKARAAQVAHSSAR